MKIKRDNVPGEDKGSAADSFLAPEEEKQMGKKLHLIRHERIIHKYHSYLSSNSYGLITAMALPFKPMTVTFENVQYYVDTPKVSI